MLNNSRTYKDHVGDMSLRREMLAYLFEMDLRHWNLPLDALNHNFPLLEVNLAVLVAVSFFDEF